MKLDILEPLAGGIVPHSPLWGPRLVPPRVVIRLTSENARDCLELERTFGEIPPGSVVEFRSEHEIEVSVLFPKPREKGGK